jgi:hypothetical protein
MKNKLNNELILIFTDALKSLGLDMNDKMDLFYQLDVIV